jgi:hypothetical protein
MEPNNPRIMIATPMAGGMCYASYFNACIQLKHNCDLYGIYVQFANTTNESLVQRGRNCLVKEFLNSDCTHLIFIDADIEFEPIHVWQLVQADKDIVCGPYARKRVNYNNVGVAARLDGTLSPEDLAYCGGDIVFMPDPNVDKFDITKPVEIYAAGTGFMCIKREVIEGFIKAYPEIEHIENSSLEVPETRWAVFEAAINPETKEYVSEDYWFCHKARQAGFNVWLLPYIKLTHYGTFGFKSWMPKVASIITKANEQKGNN